MHQTDTMNFPISITPVAFSRINEVDFDNIPFGKIYADHMFVADYSDGQWENARIVPFDNISMPPSSSALHYGQLIFEGMKAYKDQEGNAVIFRPRMNWQRFNKSALRMAMPEVPESLFMGALNELIRIDQEWIPTHKGSALYIRPFMFATEEYIGIRPAEKFSLIIFTCPVGAYYPRPVKVLVSEYYVRAFKGGTGFAKAAGNYAATMQPIKEAHKQGYDQLLWMDGCEHKYIHEIGTMNVFFVIDNKVVTPSIQDGEILDGVTRDSVITILKNKGIPVEERKVTIDEVYNAYKNGRLQDAFGTGTAATIAPISDLGYKGENLELPPVSARNISNMVKDELENIKTGRTDDRFNWNYRVN